MKIDIPGYCEIDICYLVLDYNGTIAEDGHIPEEVKRELNKLSDIFKIYVLTADTHGTASAECEGLPLQILTFPSDRAADEKLRIVNELGADHCATIGNGRNDVKMNQAAAMSMAVVGKEGAYGKLLAESEICVRSILDALELLQYPKRMIATLRG